MVSPTVPRCSKEAIAWLAQVAGVAVERCQDPEDCEHTKLPDGFGLRMTRGMSVARAIGLVEEYVGQRQPDVASGPPEPPEQATEPE